MAGSTGFSSTVGQGSLAVQDLTGDIDGDAVVPAVDVADLQGGFVGGQGAAHADGQGGSAEAELLEYAHVVVLHQEWQLQDR